MTVGEPSLHSITFQVNLKHTNENGDLQVPWSPLSAVPGRKLRIGGTTYVPSEGYGVKPKVTCLYNIHFATAAVLIIGRGLFGNERYE